MSENVNPTSAVTDASSSDTVAAPGSPKGAATEFNASTTISSMSDLQSKAPTIYKAMMEGIATNIINEMKSHQDKLKEMQRQAQREAEGKA